MTLFDKVYNELAESLPKSVPNVSHKELVHVTERLIALHKEGKIKFTREGIHYERC